MTYKKQQANVQALIKPQLNTPLLVLNSGSFGNNCTDDSYLIVKKNDNNGECTAEVHVTTLDNHTIVGKVTCKPNVVDKK